MREKRIFLENYVDLSGTLSNICKTKTGKKRYWLFFGTIMIINAAVSTKLGLPDTTMINNADMSNVMNMAEGIVLSVVAALNFFIFSMQMIKTKILYRSNFLDRKHSRNIRKTLDKNINITKKITNNTYVNMFLLSATTICLVYIFLPQLLVITIIALLIAFIIARGLIPKLAKKYTLQDNYLKGANRQDQYIINNKIGRKR